MAKECGGTFIELFRSTSRSTHEQQPCRSLLGLAERTRQPQRHTMLLSNFTFMKRCELLDTCDDVFGRTLPARYLDQKQLLCKTTTSNTSDIQPGPVWARRMHVVEKRSRSGQFDLGR